MEINEVMKMAHGEFIKNTQIIVEKNAYNTKQRICGSECGLSQIKESKI
jgi:hypothetical protein